MTSFTRFWKKGINVARDFTRKAIHTNSLYEIRTYRIHPKDMKSFLQLTSENIHLRTNHSPLVGYFTSELGGLNDVVHIWRYESLSQRAKVRQALSEDPAWLSNYISKIVPMMAYQENVLTTPTEENLTQSDLKGVYELCCVQLAAQNMPRERGDALLLGTFTTVVGSLNSSYQLWHHKDVDCLVKNLSSTPHTDKFLEGHSRMLLPVPWSPLK